MMTQKFREASEGFGKYCTDKNELRVRKGRKIYLFICGESELRFTAPGQPEVAFLLAPDATVHELSRCIAKLTEPSK